MNDSARRACPLIILEGPDGAGKSTLAARLGTELGARVVHLGPFKGLTNIAHLYVEAMQPALDGYQPVVLDRSWLSEPIYGAVHRGGRDRVGPVYARMLERVAWRCYPVVIRCLPPVEACLATFRARKGIEYLDSEAALRAVHLGYTHLGKLHGLPTLDYNYLHGESRIREVVAVLRQRLAVAPDRLAPATLPATLPVAGNSRAPYVLVGEALAERKAHDPFAQYPFVSFSGAGCSAWLAQQLLDAGIGEHRLLWANANLGTAALRDLCAAVPRRGIFVLGAGASQALRGVPGVTPVMHPQRAARFHRGEPYALISHLKHLEKTS